MKRTTIASLLLTLCLFLSTDGYAQRSKEDILKVMKKATRFIVDSVSNNGGYVWCYTPDRSRSWGEMEAYPSMIWTQPPGTPSVGQLFLDAYYATGDEYYYQAAEKVADALIWGQLPCGGWNYIIDFAGETSLKNWYATIGKNGWRLEEFHHYYGNATYDDEATYAPASFLLRMYAAKHDVKYKPALDKVIGFVLESQYPIGGWPQRYPLRYDYAKERGNYSSYITLNDDVHKNNVEFLIRCYQILGDATLLDPIRRAMNCIMILHQGAPQSGWSWQYATNLKPAGARSYEPDGLYSGATYSSIGLLMDYYELTGETKFLARIPEAMDFLDAIEYPVEYASYFPRELRPGQHLYPSCVELGTGKPLYVHRSGSNGYNGKFYIDYDPENQWMPTFNMRALNIEALRTRYNRLLQTSPEEIIRTSPLYNPQPVAPVYHVPLRVPSAAEVKDILVAIGSKPYWEGIFANSNPYIGLPPEGFTNEQDYSNYSTTQVGDQYDTSPYRFEEDFKGISMQEYIGNMSRLIYYLINP
jgi:PelA/Pel-15E family pectate lyase